MQHNALFCASKFKMNVCDIVSEMKVINVLYCERKVVEQQMQVAGFLHVLLLIRDGRFVLLNNVSFSLEEIETFIDELNSNLIFISNLLSCVIVLIYALLFVLRSRYHNKIII